MAASGGTPVPSPGDSVEKGNHHFMLLQSKHFKQSQYGFRSIVCDILPNLSLKFRQHREAAMATSPRNSASLLLEADELETWKWENVTLELSVTLSVFEWSRFR